MTTDCVNQSSVRPYGPDPDFDPVSSRAAEAGADDAEDASGLPHLQPSLSVLFRLSTQRAFAVSK